MTELDADPNDLLRQAIAISENMIRITDAIDLPLAGNYFSIGLDILRRAAGQSDDVLFDDVCFDPDDAGPAQTVER